MALVHVSNIEIERLKEIARSNNYPLTDNHLSALLSVIRNLEDTKDLEVISAIGPEDVRAYAFGDVNDPEDPESVKEMYSLEYIEFVEKNMARIIKEASDYGDTDYDLIINTAIDWMFHGEKYSNEPLESEEA
jgi:hypothetical protein